MMALKSGVLRVMRGMRGGGGLLRGVEGRRARQRRIGVSHGFVRGGGEYGVDFFVFGFGDFPNLSDELEEGRTATVLDDLSFDRRVSPGEQIVFATVPQQATQQGRRNRRASGDVGTGTRELLQKFGLHPFNDFESTRRLVETLWHARTVHGLEGASGRSLWGQQKKRRPEEGAAKSSVVRR